MGLSVTRGCELLGISRQAYYQQHARDLRREQHAQALVDFVVRALKGDGG